MPYPTVVVGDVLPALRHLASRTEVIRAAEVPFDTTRRRGVRAVVVGLDASDAVSAHDAKRRLKALLHEIVTDARGYPALVHLVIAYLAPDGVSSARLSAAASSIASRLHAAFEREIGADVEVTLLDVTACTDPQLLGDRIQERIQHRAGAYSDIALEWSDIRSSTITRAVNQNY